MPSVADLTRLALRKIMMTCNSSWPVVRSVRRQLQWTILKRNKESIRFGFNFVIIETSTVWLPIWNVLPNQISNLQTITSKIIKLTIRTTVRDRIWIRNSLLSQATSAKITIKRNFKIKALHQEYPISDTMSKEIWIWINKMVLLLTLLRVEMDNQSSLIRPIRCSRTCLNLNPPIYPLFRKLALVFLGRPILRNKKCQHNKNWVFRTPSWLYLCPRLVNGNCLHLLSSKITLQERKMNNKRYQKETTCGSSEYSTKGRDSVLKSWPHLIDRWHHPEKLKF